MSETQKSSNFENIFAEDIMTEDVEVMDQNMRVDQAAHLMLRHRVSGYPIVDESKKVIGLVTISDLFILIDKTVAFSLPEETPKSLNDKIALCKNISVAEIMSKHYISITPKTTLAEIVETVVRWNIHTFPVMDNDALVGIIGRHDILNAIFAYA